MFGSRDYKVDGNHQWGEPTCYALIQHSVCSVGQMAMHVVQVGPLLLGYQCGAQLCTKFCLQL